jgi:hypothetical protein
MHRGLGITNAHTNQPAIDGRSPGRTVRSRYALASGALCAGAALLSLPSAFFVEPGFPTAAVVGSAIATACAAVFILVSWERAPLALVEAFPAAATVLLAVDAVAIDSSYGFYLALLAGLIAYEFVDTRVVVVHVALIVAAICAPIALTDVDDHAATASALLYAPGAVLLAALAAHLRRIRDAHERAYRQFGLDALAIAARIRSRVGTEEAARELVGWLERQPPLPIAAESQTEVDWWRRWAPAGPMLAGAMAVVVGLFVAVGSLDRERRPPAPRPTAGQRTSAALADRNRHPGSHDNAPPPDRRDAHRAPPPVPSEPSAAQTAGTEAGPATIDGSSTGGAPATAAQTSASTETPARPSHTAGATSAQSAPPPSAPATQPAQPSGPIDALQSVLGPLGLSPAN